MATETDEEYSARMIKLINKESASSDIPKYLAYYKCTNPEEYEAKVIQLGQQRATFWFAMKSFLEKDIVQQVPSIMQEIAEYCDKKDHITYNYLEKPELYVLRFKILPELEQNRFDTFKQLMGYMGDETRELLMDILNNSTSSGWMTLDEAEAKGYDQRGGGGLPLGVMIEPLSEDFKRRYEAENYTWDKEETHILTSAPSGAGKGQGLIIPALLHYNGSCFVIDPKGENFRLTSKFRQKESEAIYFWSPFDQKSHSYNPLDFVSTWEDARILANLLVIPKSKDEFWDDSAKDILSSLIMYVIQNFPTDKCNMRELVGVLRGSKAQLEEVQKAMQDSNDRQLQEAGNEWDTTPENTLGSILRTAKTHLQIWADEKIEAVTRHSDWKPTDLRTEPASYEHMTAKSTADMRKMGFRCDGSYPVSIYICIPEDKIKTYSAVLRVIVAQHINELAALRHKIDRAKPEDEYSKYQNLPENPTLFILDEFPQLKYMEAIESAMGIARAARIRLWLIMQSIDQLQQTYPQWRSMVANCNSRIFFGTHEIEEAEYISKLLPRPQNVLDGGESKPLATAQEIISSKFDNYMIYFNGKNPPALIGQQFAFETPGAPEKFGEIEKFKFNDVDIMGRPLDFDKHGKRI